MAGFRRSTWFALGLMIGSFVGAALGLVLAPERGEETRREIRSRTQPTVERIRDTAIRLARRAEPAVEEGQPSGPAAEAATEGEEPPEPEAGAAKEESVAGEAGDVS